LISIFFSFFCASGFFGSVRTESQFFLGARALGSVRLALSARLGMPAMKPVEIWPQDEARVGAPAQA
jgi:hypothetical protein